MLISSRRCVVRKFRTDDANALFPILSDELVMKYIEPAFSMEQTVAFIKEAGLCDPPLVYALVLRESNRLIGHVIFHPYESNSCEIGWIIDKHFWGKGIASEITFALLEYAKMLGKDSCVIECDPRNMASKQIAAKIGFLPEGEANSCSIYRYSY